LQTLFVHENQVVAAGDHIAVLSLSPQTDVGNVGEIVSKGLQSEALAAQAKAQSQLAQLEVERDQAKSKLVNMRAELEQLLTQITLQEQRLGVVVTQVERGTELSQKGYLPLRELEARRIAAITAEQEVAGLQRQKIIIEREMANTQSRLASIPLEINAARSDAQSAQAILQQRFAESEGRRQQVVIAPVSGRLAALPVAPGQYIIMGGTVAVIIPSGARLEAELLAPSRSIGFVRPGQDVALRLQPFPYQRFGTVAGLIRTVSSTVLAPGEVGLQGLNIQEPVFRVRVLLSREVFQAYGTELPMQPGMLVSAEIVFDRRSLLQWLFDPIYAVARRA
jgi:membrane fusion protein